MKTQTLIAILFFHLWPTAWMQGQEQVLVSDDFENREVGSQLENSVTSGGTWNWWGVAKDEKDGPAIAEWQGNKFADLGSFRVVRATFDKLGQKLVIPAGAAVRVKFDILWLQKFGGPIAFGVHCHYLLPGRYSNLYNLPPPDEGAQGFLLQIGVTGVNTVEWGIYRRAREKLVPVASGTCQVAGVLDGSDESGPGTPISVELSFEGDQQTLRIAEEEVFNSVGLPEARKSYDQTYIQFWSAENRHKGIDNLSISRIDPLAIPAK